MPIRLSTIGRVMRDKAVRKTPDPLTLALGLTLLTFAAAWLVGEPATLMEPMRLWSTNTGLWKLLAFSMQAAMMLLLGGVLADAPVFRRWLLRIAKVLPSPRAMVAATALCSVSLALVNWSLSIVGGALIARECGQQAKRRGWELHYPLLCAAGYSGMMVWHGGLSGTAPLKVTRLRDLQELMDPTTKGLEIIPLEETLFSPMNLAVNLGLLLIATLGFYFITPKPGQDPEAQSAPDLEGDTLAASAPAPSPLQSGLAIIFGLLLALGCAVQLSEHGLSKLNLNVLNLGLWSLGLLAHGRLDQWMLAVERNVKGCAGILVQFPLYAGIMGLLVNLGLTQYLSGWMAQLSASASMLFTFLSAALLNVFVPSGGGQWAIQGPVILNLAAQTHRSAGPLVMAMAYGDQLTNMIQPFWALPLLGITKVRAKDISGYCLCWMLGGAIWITAMLLYFTG